MIRLTKTAWAVLAVLGLAYAAPGYAGRSCEQRPPNVQTITQGMALAQKTASYLDAEYVKTGTRVVLLARAGQDLSKYGLRYSHLGFAYKTPEGPWRVVHKLNQCGTAEAAVYRQGLGEFFLDDLWRYEAAWLVPTQDVQARLLAFVQDPQRATSLHAKPYSIVSYAWGQKYQQSNQWATETLAAAMDDYAPSSAYLTGRRDRAQAWLMNRGYQPTTLHISALTRLGARVSAANVAFDDHPNDKRFSDRIETVTVDSVFAWMPRAGLGAPPVRMELP